MLAEERKRILLELKSGLENNTTAYADGVMQSPAADYTCPDLLGEEQRVFFQQTPLFMGLSTDLPNKGSYWADSETGLPILMVRDNEGQFRAFANSCRHRGMQVVPDGRGDKARFSCPFHGWTYANSGDLIAITRAERFGPIDREDYGLIELPSAEKYGMLWVTPTPGDAIDVDACLGGLGEEMQHWNLSEHSYGAAQVLRANINWKLAIDTFGENYHFDVLHKDSLAFQIHGNLQTSDSFGDNYRMVFANTSFTEIAKAVPDVDDWPYLNMTLGVYFIYPNTIFLVGQRVVDVLRMFPDENSPNRSRTAHAMYLGPQAWEFFKNEPAGVEGRFEGFNDIILKEDYFAAESTQIAAMSGRPEYFLFGRNEPALHHYHNTHRRGLGREPLPLITN